MRDEKGKFINGHVKIGGFNKGCKHTNSARQKMTELLVGKCGVLARRWKGDNANYQAKHMWLRKYFGKAYQCQNITCIYPNPRRYEWHNLSGQHKRTVNDYMQLCPSCHRRLHNGSFEI